MNAPLFADRYDAGRKLAVSLAEYRGRPDVLVLALPRGGVPVGYEVAKALNVPLDVFLVRKLGVPGHEELAMGAIASGGVRVLNEEVVRSLGITAALIDRVVMREQAELERREKLFRAGQPPHHLQGRTVILVDDGLATGATMAAAVRGVRRLGADSLMIAVPVAAEEICHTFEPLVDRIVCLETPEPFWGVGMWYANFEQTTDEEVRSLLAGAAQMQSEGVR